jgi:hypothetical protein
MNHLGLRSALPQSATLGGLDFPLLACCRQHTVAWSLLRGVQENVTMKRTGLLVFLLAVATAGCSDPVVGGWSDGGGHWCFWDDGTAGFGDFEQNRPNYTWDDGVIREDGSDVSFNYEVEGDTLVITPGQCGSPCNGAGEYAANEAIDCDQGGHL